MPSNESAPHDLFIEKMVSLNFSTEEAHSIYDRAKGSLAWYKAGGSEHLMSVLKDLYSHTWTSTEGLPSVYSTSTGSMAGTPLGDLIFILCISQIL